MKSITSGYVSCDITATAIALTNKYIFSLESLRNDEWATTNLWLKYEYCRTNHPSATTIFGLLPNALAVNGDQFLKEYFLDNSICKQHL